jgi:hypothetical protein
VHVHAILDLGYPFKEEVSRLLDGSLHEYTMVLQTSC